MRKMYLPKEKKKKEEEADVVENHQTSEYSDSEEEEVPPDDADELHEMTNEELREHFKQVRASEGFDVQPFPKALDCGIIQPLYISSQLTREELSALSNKAIREYNKTHNTNYLFVRVVKATMQICAGARYYLTFEVDDSADGRSTLFQAIVWRGIRKEEVQLCRLAPSN